MVSMLAGLHMEPSSLPRIPVPHKSFYSYFQNEIIVPPKERKKKERKTESKKERKNTN